MALARNHKLPAGSDRQKELLADLEALFFASGFRTITVDEIAARLKCSKRTLYEIAPSKQELFVLVIESWLDRIRHKGWQGALKHDDPEQRMMAYLEPGVIETRAASRQFLADLQSYRPALTLLEAHQAQRTNVLMEIIEDGISRGRFKPFHSALVAEIFLAAVNRINEPAMLEQTGVEFSQAFDEFFRILTTGLFRDADEETASAVS
ncbi:MAG: TetR/AcrR family transcriptional regulator [Sphingomonadales bacterium]|jgi:AcrR family transcriptional regulator|nr:TetR/AcrR family transcriptional regulator [Sphingomonadales bacterium]